MHVSEVKIAESQEERSATAGVPCDDQLLSALWRSQDQCHQMAVFGSNNIFRNLEVRGAAQAIKQALSLSWVENDTYFACAEYLTSDNRTAANVSGAWAFWMDLDCGEDKAASGKGYSTVEAAEEALKSFCTKVGIPLPTHLVNSGSGLHVYWVLDGKVDREPWQATAKKLKALTKTLVFLADDSRTSDIASVLRIPGTLNYKYNPPRPVTLLRATDNFVSRDLFLGAIDSAYESLCNVAATARLLRAPRLNSVGETDKASNDHDDVGPLPYQQLTKKEALDHLLLLQELLRHIDADICHDDWAHVGMALFYETAGCDDGLALFDDWSRGGEKYKGAKETRAKWRSFRSAPGVGYKIGTLFLMARKAGHSPKMIYAEVSRLKNCGDDQDAA